MPYERQPARRVFSEYWAALQAPRQRLESTFDRVQKKSGTNEDDFFELQVVVAGGPHARYEYRASDGELGLAAIGYPDAWSPGDLCVLPNSLTASGGLLRAIVLGTISHPPACFLQARLLGMVELEESGWVEHLLINVAAGDSHFDGQPDIAALSPFRQRAIEQFLCSQARGRDPLLRWKSLAEARHVVYEARRAFRLAQARKRTTGKLEPAWRPLFNTRERETARETDPHSAAEYAYARLPARFQQYVATNLARDERILMGLHRPAMRSSRRHGFHRAPRLQEAVFLVGDRQVTELAELMPPDRAGIRYGFVARGSVPERLEGVEVVDLSRDVVGLAATWGATGGCERHVWEFPASQRAAVEAAARLLSGWLARDGDSRLRRASLPQPPESFADLSDPGANDPADTRRLVARLLDSLKDELQAGEQALACCLLPAWIHGRGAASLLAITGRRLLVVPDPNDAAAAPLRLSINHGAISSFEFSSTLLVAYLKLYIPNEGGTTEQVIRFGSTLAEIDDCFHVLRQAVAATPPFSQHEQG